MSAGIFRREDQCLVHNVSEVAWRHTAFVLVIIAAVFAMVAVLAAFGPMPGRSVVVLVAALCGTLAYWMLHNTRELTVFDATRRELRFYRTRWLYWRSEPPPQHRRTINFERIASITVDTTEDEDEGKIYRLVAFLTDRERIIFASDFHAHDLEAAAHEIREVTGLTEVQVDCHHW